MKFFKRILKIFKKKEEVKSNLSCLDFKTEDFIKFRLLGIHGIEALIQRSCTRDGFDIVIEGRERIFIPGFDTAVRGIEAIDSCIDPNEK